MSTTKESITHQEMVARCQLLSEDDKSYVTNQAQFVRALIGQWAMLKAQGVAIRLPEGATLEDFFIAGLIDIIKSYEELMGVTNQDMERATFLAIERVRRQLIMGISDARMAQTGLVKSETEIPPQ